MVRAGFFCPPASFDESVFCLVGQKAWVEVGPGALDRTGSVGPIYDLFTGEHLVIGSTIVVL